MKNFLVTVMILLSFTLCGCYDFQEIDKSAYVIALGIDKGENGYNYTFQISSPLAMGGGGEVGSMGEGEENSRVENIIIGSDSLSDARANLNNFLSKKINLSHLKIIVFSEEVTKIGLSPHLPFLLREREIRPNTRLAVSASSAEDFLKGINPALEANTAEYYDLVFENGQTFSPDKTLWEFVNEQETFASALPCGIMSTASKSDDFAKGDTPLRISTSKSEFSGLYLIKDYKFAGKLTPAQSRTFALLSGEIDEAEFGVSNGSGNHSVKIFPVNKSDFHMRQTDTSTTIFCRSSFLTEINSSDASINIPLIKEILDREIYSLFTVLHNSGCDILNIGNIQKRECKTAKEWENLNWNTNFNTFSFMPETTIIISKTDSNPI